MNAYLAECYWPGVTEAEVLDLVGRARVAAEQLRGEGQAVAITGSWLMPADEVAFLLLDAPTIEAARDLSARAGVPCERIVEAVSVSTGDPKPTGTVGEAEER